MKKTILKEQDFITGLDYSCILLDSYSNTMETLKVMKNPVIKQAYDSATEAMAHLYQTIGQELNKHEKNLERKATKDSRRVHRSSK